jgi:hypothetical protein
VSTVFLFFFFFSLFFLFLLFQGAECGAGGVWNACECESSRSGRADSL